jgi:hypothetical protein
MKDLVKIKIYTSFGEKWVISLPDKKTADTFARNIDNPDFPWVIVHPMFVGNRSKVKIKNSSIVALEIIESKEEEKDNE